MVLRGPGIARPGMFSGAGCRLSQGRPAEAPPSEPAGLVELDSGDPRWLDFAESCGAATAFHNPAWMHAIRQAYGYRALILALVDTRQQVRAGIPLLRASRLGRPAFVSLPFTDHCPPLASDQESLSRMAEEISSWQGQQGRKGTPLEVRGAMPAARGWSLATAGVRHLLSLEGSFPGVESRLPSPIHRHVRSAQRSGLRARITCSRDDLAAFYRLHLLTRRRLGVPVQPRRFIEAVWANVVEAGIAFAVLAETADGQPAGAGLFVLGSQSTALKYSASDPTLWHLKPNHLVLWTAIERACELGCSVFDFGRSELEHTTLRRFKSSWGAVETPLVYSSCGPAGGAGRGVLGASRAREALSQVIRRSPVFVCQAVGELLYPLAG
jgi:CelD/BcsL family acetyltransferase involved in cellulose biosynthesis